MGVAMRYLRQFLTPALGLAAMVAASAPAGAALIAPELISSGNTSIPEGSFTNPNVTVFNPNPGPVTFGGVMIRKIGMTLPDMDDFAIINIPNTGTCFSGFPLGPPVVIGGKPAEGNGPANSCDIDFNVTTAPLDPLTEDGDFGITTFEISVGWSTGETSTTLLHVEVTDPGVAPTIGVPEPSTLGILGLALAGTLWWRRKFGHSPLTKDP